MHDENLHNEPLLNKSYPDPGINVENAWADMHARLDDEMPVVKVKKPGWKNWKWPGGIFILGLIIATIWLVVKQKEVLNISMPIEKRADLPNVSSGNNQKETAEAKNTRVKGRTDSENLVKVDSVATFVQPGNSANNITRLVDSNLGVGILKQDSTTRLVGTLKGNGVLDNPDLRKSTGLTLVNKKRNVNPVNDKAAIKSFEKKAIVPIDKKGKKQGQYLTPPSAFLVAGDKGGNKNKNPDPVPIAAEADYFIPYGLDKDIAAGNTALMNDPFSQFPKAEKKSQTRINEELLDSAKKISGGNGKLSVNTKNAGIFKDIHYGAQWNIPLPIQGTDNLFTGASGGSQVYGILIPQIWITKNWGAKHELRFVVDAFAKYYLGSQTLASSTGTYSGTDSTLVIRDSSLINSQGFSLALLYNHHLAGRWTIGAGLQYQWQSKALGEIKTVRASDQAKLSGELISIDKSSTLWNYIAPGFLVGRVEAGYSFRNATLGAGVLIPVTSLTSGGSPKAQPINGQVFIRWRIH
ncbi:hypothetical protein [Flavihumibacter profundi]|uniref:hypothetical protein n=1 Tax=Flavihumibacter profundi TaxID=2716883 RepID=UPI001CC58A1A|nr:hypothetical protein [Flavihumibacter profundi]MBZ5856795.1 hypothetical protein [Flavihumibacter profundi]